MKNRKNALITINIQKMNIRIKRMNIDQKVALFISFAVFDYLYIGLFSMICSKFTSNANIAIMIFYILQFYFFISAVENSKIKFDITSVAMICIVVTAVIILLLTERGDFSYIKDESSWIKVLFYYLPVFLLVYSQKNFALIEKYIIYSAYILIHVCLYQVIFNIVSTPMSIATDHLIHASYPLALCIIVIFYNLVKKGKILMRWQKLLSFCYIIFGIMANLIRGSRGSLLSIVIGISYLVIVNHLLKSSIIKKIITVSSLTIFISLFVNYYQDIVIKIHVFLTKNSIYSRTLEMIYLETDGNNAILGSSGRDNFILNAIDIFWKNNKWFGYGLFGDRKLYRGIYIHNMFVEIIIQFGVIFGGPILIYLIIRYILFSISIKENSITSIIVLYTTSYLMLSNSYSHIAIAWVMFGILLNNKILFRRKRMEEHDVEK